jgi:hypothetical protein
VCKAYATPPDHHDQHKSLNESHIQGRATHVELTFHHCSANGSSDGNQLAATPHNPRFPLTFLLVSHLYARSAPVAVWLHSMSKRIAA